MAKACSAWFGSCIGEGLLRFDSQDTIGHLLAAHLTAANEPDRAQVSALADVVQRATGEYRWPMWTKATRAKRPLKRLKPKASILK